MFSTLTDKALLHLDVFSQIIRSDIYSINMAPATTASKPSLTTTAFAAPVCAAEDEEATDDDDPVWLALLDLAELLEDCLAELLLEPEDEALLLLVAAPEVAAPAAKDPLLLDAAFPLDEATAVASAALPVMAPGPWLPVAV